MIDDFGLGTWVKDFPGLDLSVTDNSIPSGTYRYNPNAMTGGPVAGWGSVIHVRRATSGGEVQLFLLESATYGGRVYLRSRSTGSWAPWSRLYGSLDIVGAVGQTDGIPTGGLFQRISNANGEAVRYADGTQICWGTALLTRDTPYRCRGSWSYPASWSVAPVVHVSVLTGTGPGYGDTAATREPWGAASTPGSTLSGPIALDAPRSYGAPDIPEGATVQATVIAFGRWY